MVCGQGSIWVIDSPTMFYLCITHPYQRGVSFILKYIYTAIWLLLR